MILTIVNSESPVLRGFKFFWLKRVHGFDPSQHCAGCLKGTYIKEVGKAMPVDTPIELPDLPFGQVYYLCGVSVPYNWQNNFHLIFKQAYPNEPAPLEGTLHDLWTKAKVHLQGARTLPIDASVAEAAHPSKAKQFLTCRNFQFGAQYYGKHPDT